MFPAYPAISNKIPQQYVLIAIAYDRLTAKRTQKGKFRERYMVITLRLEQGKLADYDILIKLEKNSVDSENFANMGSPLIIVFMLTESCSDAYFYLLFITAMQCLYCSTTYLRAIEQHAKVELKLGLATFESLLQTTC